MKYLVLMANCFPVKGHRRSIVCDTVRHRYEFIPNSLYDFICKYNKCEVSAIRADFPEKETWDIAQSYLQFLEEKEFIFYTSKPELFTSVDLHWESPLRITNSIIDFDEFSNHDLKIIVTQLNDLFCEAIEFRDFYGFSPDTIREIAALTKDSTCRSIYLLIKYNGPYETGFFENLIKNNRRIMSVIVHSTPVVDHRQADTKEQEDWYNISYTSQVLTDETHCGSVSKLNFSTSMAMFMESHFYNSCLNKKLSIDKRGLIRNCPSSKQDFGHHTDTLLWEALETPGFKKYWSITKDQVNVCKDCEFRYICTDCRMYTRDSDDMYAKPAKCSYDPYTASWTGLTEQI